MIAMADEIEKTKRFAWVRLNDKGEPSLRTLNVFLVVAQNEHSADIIRVQLECTDGASHLDVEQR